MRDNVLKLMYYGEEDIKLDNEEFKKTSVTEINQEIS